MNENSDSSKTEVIKKIRKRLFSFLLDWKRPVIHDVVGPYDPSRFDDFSDVLEEIIENVDELLSKYTLDELNELAVRYYGFKSELSHLWDEFPNEEIRWLSSHTKHWFVGGFGSEKHKADYNYWSKMQSFSLDEATCLTIGFDPKFMDERAFTETIEEHAGYGDVPEFYYKRRNQIDRKFRLRENRSNVTFRSFFDWVLVIDLEVPEDFLMSFQRIADRGNAPRKAPVAKKFDHREKVSLAQLFVAIAITEYGYAPEDTRSPVPKEIQDLAAKLGLEISNDTIRKYLKLGGKYLPDDWQHE